ncbi:hypothetical protein Q0M94_10740 [Deinococcus radiomollis]|uniref:hypothetical protein n=1 Tax=Deinococcus radiomollis TaxID=468916 RepID=UPI003891633E
MADDPKISHCRTLINIVIAEVKTSRCALNGPWTDPEKANIQRVLRSVGCIPLDKIEEAASFLYLRGIWIDEAVTLRLFALGDSIDSELPLSLDQQVTWEEIIAFCHRRFNQYRKQKSSVGIWAEDGIQLKKLAERREPDIAGIRRIFGLPPFSTPEVERTSS